LGDHGLEAVRAERPAREPRLPSGLGDHRIMHMKKLLAHFIVHSKQHKAVGERLRDLAREWHAALPDKSTRATVMIALEDDPMRGDGEHHPTRAFDASIEVLSDAPNAFEEFESISKGLAERLKGLVQPDLSALQIGLHKVFIACAPSPVRYQYCMRRRHDFTNADYLKRYEEIHSQFGLKTPGIEGYSQFHIDQAASQRACAEVGFGISRVDSVSELHLESLEKFLGTLAEASDIGAGEDEDRFVDRLNSVMWVSDEVFRVGD
jgi:hypothetical protein